MTQSIDYKNLTVKPSLSWWLNHTTIFYLQKLFYKIPFLGKPFRFLGYRLFFLGNLAEQERKRLKYVSMLKNPAETAQEFGSEYGYNDAVRELEVTAKYHAQIKQMDFERQASESAGVYAQAVKALSGLLDKDKNITHLVNFGVCYAHVDSILAEKYPHVHFIGIDRSYFTKLYNEEYFAERKNMEFIAGDIMDLIKQRQFGAPCLLHIRTACYLPKTFMESLYQLAFDKGFQYIIGLEQFGVSRENLKPFEFSPDDRSSAIFRDGFFMHNYPGMVIKAGFSIEQIEAVKTNHPHEDYRVLSFVAKRRSQ